METLKYVYEKWLNEFKSADNLAAKAKSIVVLIAGIFLLIPATIITLISKGNSK